MQKVNLLYECVVELKDSVIRMCSRIKRRMSPYTPQTHTTYAENSANDKSTLDWKGKDSPRNQIVPVFFKRAIRDS